MIKFDANSIYINLLTKLQQDPNWKVVSNNSVVSSLIRNTAEVNAETARYAEYLFKESKWDTAQNTSSILAMSNMLGYQPKRRVSARGAIYVSTDPRTHLVGKTFSSETFKNLSTSSTYWSTPDSTLSITSAAEITDSAGNSYVALPSTLDAGSYYKQISIVQGKKKSLYIDINTIRSTVVSSKMDPYLYIPATITACEDASNTSSKGFFRVYTIIKDSEGNLTYQEYRIVDSLLLSSSNLDGDVEVYNDLYSREMFYLKFNNDPLRGKTLDLSQNSSLAGIKIDYLESLGSSGNVLNTFETFTISGATTANGTSIKLYGVNFESIIGGKDEETVVEIKANAPKYYVTNYSVGTKEAYEKIIATLEMPVGDTVVIPKKVQVYGGSESLPNGLTRPITCITFTAEGLEDLATSSDSATAYSAIEDSLNYYLDKLKSPQDTLVFKAPNYVAFALGINCVMDSSEVNTSSIAEDIRSVVEENWGPSSDELDFSRNFYPSQTITDLKNSFSNIKGINVEVEAIKKLDWSLAERKNPSIEEESQVNVIHTCRLPFSFNRVFYGQSSIEGFKDYRSGASYVMRIDFMYKKPSSMSTSTNYHTSLFVQEASTRRSNEAFYVINDTNSNNNIWNMTTTSGGSTPILLLNSDYTDLSKASRLTKTWQFRYKNKVYRDDEFQDLISDESLAQSSPLKTYLIDPGAIDDYLIYFSANYDESSEAIGSGYLEFTFDPIYRVLSTFSLYDPTLSAALKDCNLSLLKCGNQSTGEDVFTQFKNIASKYIDIYVCMRPCDSNLVLSSKIITNKNSILYIDSLDSSSSTYSQNIENLTSAKRSRMISVDCTYEE